MTVTCGRGRTRVAVMAMASVATGAAGCGETIVYGYQYKLTQQFGAGEAPEMPANEARALLAGAKTVAFFPPDICLNAVNADHLEAKTEQVRASCGVLLSTLEHAAEQAGYEVLSWQNLRGKERPIDFAREANVDVLFEINEFDLGTLDDAAMERTLTFFEAGPFRDDPPTVTAPRPLVVASTVAAKCRTYAVQRHPAELAALTGTIDIKTVSVSDGRNRWRYRKTLARSLGREYPQVEFVGHGSEKLGAKILGYAAVLSLIGGATLLLTELATEDDPEAGTEKFDSDGWSTRLLVGGGIALVGAGALHLATGTTLPRPEDVLCNDALAREPAPPAQPEAVTLGALSAQHTFSEQTTGDPLSKERDQIRDVMIKEFIDVLGDAHRAAPPPDPSPAPTP